MVSMVASTLDLADIRDSVRTWRDLGAVVASVRQAWAPAGVTAATVEPKLEALVRDFARPVLNAPDSLSGMVEARRLAPAFLLATVRATSAPSAGNSLSHAFKANLEQLVAEHATPAGRAGVRFAAACCRDALHLLTDVVPWAQRATFDTDEDISDFVAQAAVSDLLLFVAFVGLADGDFERRPELTDLARLAWDHVVRRYWATLDLVLDHIDEDAFKRFSSSTWQRSQARRDELIQRGATLTVAREAWEYWGDGLIGRYLQRAVELTLGRLPHARLELDIAPEPETDDIDLVLRMHVSGLAPATAIDAERAVMKAIASDLPDCLVESLVVDLRIDE